MIMPLGPRQVPDLTRSQSTVIANVCASTETADILADLLKQAANDPETLRSIIKNGTAAQEPAIEIPPAPFERLQVPSRDSHVLALMIVDSLKQYDNGIVTVTIPGGVSTVDAMKALNEYFRHHHAEAQRDAISPRYIESLVAQGSGALCDILGIRTIAIYHDVPEARGETRTRQAEILSGQGMVLASPEDVALVAAAVACVEDGADLFEGCYVRCSTDNKALVTYSSEGIVEVVYCDQNQRREVTRAAAKMLS